MLANVLPGLRDVRAPLAAGYLWLLGVYIALEPLAPRHPYHGIWKSLSHLERTFSVIGTGVAVSFLAYVLGSMSESMFGLAREFLIATMLAIVAPLQQYLSDSAPSRRGPAAAEGSGERRTPGFFRMPNVLPPGEGPLGARTALYVTQRGSTALADVVADRVEALVDVLPENVGLATLAVSVREQHRLEGQKLSGDVQQASRRGEDRVSALESNARELVPHDVQQALRPLRDLLRDLGDRACQNVEHAASEPDPGKPSEVLHKSLAESVIDELRLARTSMIESRPSLFSEIDRLQSEAEFRDAISIPLAGLAVALFWRATWWSGLLVATASAILWVSGWLHRKSANDSLVEALRMGDAHAPSLDRVDRAVEALKVLVVSPACDEHSETVVRGATYRDKLNL